MQNDATLKKLFQQAVDKLGGEWTEEIVSHVRMAVTNFVAHARTEVDWKKYRAETTDRTTTQGRNKKKKLREILK